MYFHTDRDTTVTRIAVNLDRASREGLRVRFDVDGTGRLRFKIGEGMWSEPIESTPDPYRDGA